MAWEKVTHDMPAADERGERPARDGQGRLRPTEAVPYEPLSEIELEINALATVADRRWLEATLDSLGNGTAPFSTVYASNFNATLREVARRFIRGIRIVEDGSEHSGQEAAEEFAAALEYDHALVFMHWLLLKSRLESRKKKSWSSLFGSPT